MYTWRDVCSVNGRIVSEEFPISGAMDGAVYRIDEFLDAVASKYGVDSDAISTYMMDGINFESGAASFSAEECGCYINGAAEWLRNDPECGPVIKIVTEEPEGRRMVWMVANTLNGVLDFLQYILDTFSRPERFLVADDAAGKTWNALELATSTYGMRKRTFHERLDDIKTYKMR